MLFLNLRARSVGEILTVGMRHPAADKDDDVCTGVTQVEINCNDIKLHINNSYYKDITYSQKMSDFLSLI